MKKNWWLVLLVAGQTLLLGIEVLSRYDTTPRQIALAITNVATVVAVLGFNRWLGRRGSALSWLTVVLVFAAVWLDALGNFQHLYGGFWWWDRITHFIGGMAVSAGFIDFYQAWRRTGKLSVTWGQAAWLGYLVGQFIGALYEVSEYIGDSLFHTKRVTGPYDTPHDLLNNMLGGAAVVLTLYLIHRRQNRKS